MTSIAQPQPSVSSAPLHWHIHDVDRIVGTFTDRQAARTDYLRVRLQAKRERRPVTWISYSGCERARCAPRPVEIQP